MDNVKYCGYCDYHYQRINKKIVKTIPAFKPVQLAPPVPCVSSSPDGSSGDKSAASLGLKEAAKHLGPATSSSNKGKGKRGRKPGCFLEPKLDPPKFNPDLAAINASNHCLTSHSSSVTSSSFHGLRTTNSPPPLKDSEAVFPPPPSN